MLNKRDVRRAFSRAAGTYDDAAVLQREVCARLMDKLSFIKITPQRVIDLGCGTGHSIRLLKQRFGKAQLVGLDIALPMLEAMRGERSLLTRWLRRDTVAPLCADAEQLPLGGKSVDLVFSNFTLQWCDAGKVFPEVARVLKPGGLFLFSLPGPDTLKELRNAFAVADGVHAVPHVNRFTDMHDIGDWLVQAGFADPVMDMEMLTMTYPTVKDVVRDLKAIGAVNSLTDRSRALTGKSRWKRMEAAYETQRKDGMLPATYEVIYGHAWKVERKPRTTADGRSIIEFRDYKKSTGT